MSNWGPGAGAAAWNLRPFGASAAGRVRGPRNGEKRSGRARKGAHSGASDSVRSNSGGLSSGLASSTRAASASSLVVAAASATAGSLAQSILSPASLEAEPLADASAGAGTIGQSSVCPFALGSYLEGRQAGASGRPDQAPVAHGSISRDSPCQVQSSPGPESPQQGRQATAAADPGLVFDRPSPSPNASHIQIHSHGECDRDYASARSEAECSRLESWLKESAAAGAPGLLAATGAVAVMLHGVGGRGLGLLSFLGARTPLWGWGPLSLSLTGIPFGQPRKGKGQPGKGGDGMQGQGSLDWVDRALVKLGAVRLGWRPPSSLTDRIIALNCTVFALDLLMGRRLTLLGAKVNVLILKRLQLWRLLTPALLHGDFLHLFMNCTALRNVGPAVENLLGPQRFLAVYGLSALGGCAASTFLSPAPAVGASGAVFGLMGALSTFYLLHRKALRAHGQRDYSQVLVRTVALNLLLGAIPPSSIDNWGHVGGLLCGSALMLYYSLQAKKRAEQPRPRGL